MRSLTCLYLLLILASPSSSHQRQEEEGGLHESFVRCVSRLSPDTTDPSDLVNAPGEASYRPLLSSTIQNLRFASPRTTPGPSLLLTPRTVSEVRASVACCRGHGLTVRARSGGHDFEGLSYRALRPGGDGRRRFAVIDVAELRSVRVDADRRVARAQPGATLGELYYAVAKGSGGALGFPAGICPTVCVGGHLSGGGFGPMMRKYGLAADNVVDAEVVDAEGRLLDRAAMGEDHFWAIRGGGGGSFGIVVSWTVRLVPVPIVVSVFTVRQLLREGRDDEQATLRLLTKWQRVAHALPDDLFVKAAMEPKVDDSGERWPLVIFKSLFLGNCSGMIAQMDSYLPELDVKPSDCREMNWIQSTLYFNGYTSDQPAEVLLDRTLQPKGYYKIKLDYLTSPIPTAGLTMLLTKIVEEKGGSIDIDPQGGRMREIPESNTPYAHRRGYLYNVQYFVKWGGERNVSYEEKHLDWVREVHKLMTPYVSKGPRAAYINFRDLDLGQNVEGNTSYEEAMVWGEKYFRGNFRRLAMVKGEVDHEQVFWSEQSIPPLIVPRRKRRGGLVSET